MELDKDRQEVLNSKNSDLRKQLAELLSKDLNVDEGARNEAIEKVIESVSVHTAEVLRCW